MSNNGKDTDRGARPEVELAVLESDIHHIREQNDIDRRSAAARLKENRERWERLEDAVRQQATQLARVGDLCNRLEVANTTNTATLTAVLVELAERRGGIKIVGALAVGVPVVLELLRALKVLP
jgi:hypothetical protein